AASLTSSEATARSRSLRSTRTTAACRTGSEGVSHRRRKPGFAQGGTFSGKGRPRFPLDSDRDRKPAWLAGRMDFDRPWCWKKLDVGAGHRVQARLSAFEQMTYGEIEGKQNHEIPVEQLGKEARDRLIEL